MKSYKTTLDFYGKFSSMPSIDDGMITKCFGSQSRWRLLSKEITCEGNNTYKLLVHIKRAGQNEFTLERATSQAGMIKEKIVETLLGWKQIIPSPDGDDSDGIPEDKAVQELLTFPANVNEHFDHIYDRDMQIRECLKTIEIARDTDMLVRNHVLLYGPPGGGKTEIGLSIAKMLGELAVKRLDATATTKAGAEQLLLKLNPIPPVIVIEELEKGHPDNIPWMLSVLDERGEIIKTNSRIGSVAKLARCLVIATVNNMEKFRMFHEGALFDRFGLQLYCPYPDKELLRKVLLREIQLIPNGNPLWIDPAIEYATEVERTVQIRRIKAIMAVAGDSLLDGSYQKQHLHLKKQEEDDQGLDY